MKNPLIKSGSKKKLCFTKVLTDLNTQFNGASSKKEEKLIKSIQSIAQMTQEGFQNSCEVCSFISIKEELPNEHVVMHHEREDLSAKIESVFLSHHVGEDEALSVNIMWDILLTEDDSKELSDDDKKEVLKLHKYFAHRSGEKLWQNLFNPAGKLRGKKKLILDFLDKCDVCRRYRRTPPRPKVGLPKSQDINEVVSMDLKILKKSGIKEIGILYFHEFSKLTKGQVIDNKNKETIIKGIESKWIVGDGMGPGHPSKGFLRIMEGNS